MPSPKLTEVCPVCWKKCAFYKRLLRSKFTDEEFNTAFRLYHRDVCSDCKRLRCKGSVTKCSKRSIGRNKVVPGWWKGQ